MFFEVRDEFASVPVCIRTYSYDKDINVTSGGYVKIGGFFDKNSEEPLGTLFVDMTNKAEKGQFSTVCALEAGGGGGYGCDCS